MRTGGRGECAMKSRNIEDQIREDSIESLGSSASLFLQAATVQCASGRGPARLIVDVTHVDIHGYQKCDDHAVFCFKKMHALWMPCKAGRPAHKSSAHQDSMWYPQRSDLARTRDPRPRSIRGCAASDESKARGAGPYAGDCPGAARTPWGGGKEGPSPPPPFSAKPLA